MDLSPLFDKIFTEAGAAAGVAFLGWYLTWRDRSSLLEHLFKRDAAHAEVLGKINAVLEVIKDRLGGLS